MPVLSERISNIKVSGVMEMQRKAGELRAKGLDLVDFGIGEPDFNTPEHIKLAAFKALERNETKYTNAGGITELRSAVSEKYKSEYGAQFDPKTEIMIAGGGKQVLFNLTEAILGPGDEVLLPVPYWVSFPDQIVLAGAKVIPIEPTAETDHRLTAAQVESSITPNTKAIILNFPNNPSGQVIEQSEIAKIVELARKHNFIAIFDECYEKFVYEGDPISGAPHGKENVVLVGSCSKTYAMTGWRIGWGAGPAEIIKAMEKLQGQSASNTNSIAQWAAVEALTGPQGSVGEMLAEYRRRRDYIVDELRSIPGVTCHKPEGAFYVFPNISEHYQGEINNSTAFATYLLEKANVITVPGSEFGQDGHVRISYATSMEKIAEGVGRIKSLLS